MADEEGSAREPCGSYQASPADAGIALAALPRLPAAGSVNSARLGMGMARGCAVIAGSSEPRQPQGPEGDEHLSKDATIDVDTEPRHWHGRMERLIILAPTQLAALGERAPPAHRAADWPRGEMG